jgi:Putative restriction endonuclease
MNAPLRMIPPLENGDCLSRDEFERRYAAMPEVKKAELIEGIVYMPSPVRQEHHGKQDSHLMTVLGLYRIATPGVECGHNSTVRLDLDNEPQPDDLLYIEPACGGAIKLDAEGYIVGAPELAGEIAASSASIDLGPKMRAYRRNGVREYVVWRVLDEAIDWFILRGSDFEPLAADAEGVLRSETFPGLWLDAAALIRGDLLRVHAVLQTGLASVEHQAFVERLRRQRLSDSGGRESE